MNMLFSSCLFIIPSSRILIFSIMSCSCSILRCCSFPTSLLSFLLLQPSNHLSVASRQGGVERVGVGAPVLRLLTRLCPTLSDISMSGRRSHMWRLQRQWVTEVLPLMQVGLGWSDQQK